MKGNRIMAITKKLVELANDLGDVKGLLDKITKGFTAKKDAYIKKARKQVEGGASRSTTATGSTYVVETDAYKVTVANKIEADKAEVIKLLSTRPEYKGMTAKDAKAKIESKYTKTSFDASAAFAALKPGEQKKAEKESTRLTITAKKEAAARIEPWDETVYQKLEEVTIE